MQELNMMEVEEIGGAKLGKNFWVGCCFGPFGALIGYAMDNP